MSGKSLFLPYLIISSLSLLKDKLSIISIFCSMTLILSLFSSFQNFELVLKEQLFNIL